MRNCSYGEATAQFKCSSCSRKRWRPQGGDAGRGRGGNRGQGGRGEGNGRGRGQGGRRGQNGPQVVASTTKKFSHQPMRQSR